MKLFLYQLKQAYLSLKQKPGFVFSVVSTMGITLGALLCVLTLAYVMLIKPLPYPDQERLYRVEHQLISNEGLVDGRAFTYPNLMHLYQQQTLFSQSALSYFDADVLTSNTNEPMVTISYVTPQWFEIFATKLEKGRAFSSSETLDTYHPVAILSYETWQTEFDGKKDILDEKISFAGNSYRVVGVTAKNNIELPLAGPGFNTQIYVPWDFNPFSEEQRKRWGNDDSGLSFIGKLKAEGSSTPSITQINHQLSTLINDNWQLQVSHQAFFKGWSIKLEASLLQSYLVGDSKRSVLLLIIGALGLVIIACANISNLFVSRTAERQQQLAIHAAIGASKGQLFQTILAEITLIMSLSMIVAQFITFAGFTALNFYLADFLPRVDELTLNAFSLSASFSLLLVLTLVFSYLCRNMINYRSLNSTLQSSGKGNGIQVSKRVRNILISSQIATATALIFINILLYTDAIELVDQPLGYETEQTFAAVLAVANIEENARSQKISELKAQLLSSPKIKAISQGMRPSIFSTRAATLSANNHRYTLSGKDVDHQYFSLINQSIIEGDNFTEADIKDRTNVMVINDVFAKMIAPNGSAIGMKFMTGRRVIGVVKSINIPGRNYAEPRFYYPASLARNMLLIKLHPQQTLSRTELVRELKGVSTQLSLFSYSSLTDYKNERLFSSIATAITTVVLAILTLLLSALGLYGILSYASHMRRFEIGTRLAIGAKGKDIIQMVLRDNANAIIIGVVLSLLILLGLYIGFNEQLHSYLSTEILPIFISTLSLILIISFFACYLPLRQYINKPAIHSLRGSD